MSVKDLTAVRQIRLVEHLDRIGNAKVEDLAQLLDATRGAIFGPRYG